MSAAGKISLLLSVALTAIAAYTCLQIELFNFRAGGYLPRKPDGDDGQVSKWRCISGDMLRKIMERRYQSDAAEQNKPVALTDEQQQRIAAAVAEADQNVAFREFVGTWGLAQYIIAPVALVFSLKLVFRRIPVWARVAASAAAVLSVLCVVMMLCRNYIGALGW